MNTHLHPRAAIIAGTAVIVCLYLTLAFVSLFCVTAHASHHGSTHSSSLCFWACQANNSVSLITLVTPALPLLLFVALLELSLQEFPTVKRAHLFSRGPPR